MNGLRFPNALGDENDMFEANIRIFCLMMTIIQYPVVMKHAHEAFGNCDDGTTIGCSNINVAEMIARLSIL